MFAKVLVANRGEISVRVIRALDELGIASVAVYSEIDRDALHVQRADEAYLLGGPTAAESYLNVERILEVAREAGVPSLPGTTEPVATVDDARRIIDAEIGYPVAVKAAGGGGGKGFRVAL